MVSCHWHCSWTFSWLHCQAVEDNSVRWHCQRVLSICEPWHCHDMPPDEVFWHWQDLLVDGDGQSWHGNSVLSSLGHCQDAEVSSHIHLGVSWGLVRDCKAVLAAVSHSPPHESVVTAPSSWQRHSQEPAPHACSLWQCHPAIAETCSGLEHWQLTTSPVSQHVQDGDGVSTVSRCGHLSRLSCINGESSGHWHCQDRTERSWWWWWWEDLGITAFSCAFAAWSSEAPPDVAAVSHDHLCVGAVAHGKSGLHMQLSSRVSWLSRHIHEVGSSDETVGAQSQLDMTSCLKLSHRHDLCGVTYVTPKLSWHTQLLSVTSSSVLFMHLQLYIDSSSTCSFNMVNMHLSSSKSRARRQQWCWILRVRFFHFLNEKSWHWWRSLRTKAEFRSRCRLRQEHGLFFDGWSEMMMFDDSLLSTTSEMIILDDSLLSTMVFVLLEHGREGSSVIGSWAVWLQAPHGASSRVDSIADSTNP